MTDDIVARLRRDEAQLREYLHLARKFGGDECGICVKSPDHLLLDLGEAISKIEAAEARARELAELLAAGRPHIQDASARIPEGEVSRQCCDLLDRIDTALAQEAR